MIEASAVPVQDPPQESAANPKRTLRRKGLVLFVLVSTYVVAGSGLLAWYGLQGAAPSPWTFGRAGPLLGFAAVCVLLGLVVFGAFLTLFLGRLAADLDRVQARAVQVARGAGGESIVIERDDEVGTLARAIESMAADLQARQAHIEAARLEQFHSERMMLLGGIAAGVAHEIGNPVAGIAAIASELAAAKREGRTPDADPQDLVELSERVAATTRRLALAAGHRSREPEQLSLNALVEGVTSLVALDARFRHIEIEARLDPGLPALRAAEDDLLKLLLYLLTNAAEALAEPALAKPTIRVTTRNTATHVTLVVDDNGRGMDAQTLARAFEPYFTTKPAGRGNGLGLDACRRIAQRYGGSVRLESTPGGGTRALCRLPTAPGTTSRLLS